MDGRPPGLHHHPAVWLLVERGAYLPHLATQPEDAAGEGERAAPLPGTGFGGDPLDSLLGVVVRLGHRGVRLVRPCRAHALILEIDARRGVERLLESVCPVERCRTPHGVDVENRTGDVDVAVPGDLLTDEGHRKQGSEVVGTDRLVGAGVERRRWRLRKVRHHVVPGGGHLRLVEDVLGALRHGPAPFSRCSDGTKRAGAQPPEGRSLMIGRRGDLRSTSSNPASRKVDATP